MNKVAITVSALALAAAMAGACSNSNDSEKPPAREEGSGGSGGRTDGGGPDDDAGEDGDKDGGITDARDELIPNDGSREGDSGDAGGDEDAVPPECIFAEHCADKVTLGVCEVALCRSGACVVELAPLGSSCDDGLDCSSGGLCKDGVCTPGFVDVSRPECVDKPFPKALWITEIMAKPRAIDGQVHETGGQWVEVTNRSAKETHLQGVHLVRYDWPSGQQEPDVPDYSYVVLGDVVLSSEASVIVARSFEAEQNGGLKVPFAFGDAVDLAAGEDARLLLVMPEWGRGGYQVPIPSQYIIDSVYIPGGTFSEANQGRSLQAGAPLPAASEPEARVFCHTPVDSSNAYTDAGALKNYGTPGATNVSCEP